MHFYQGHYCREACLAAREIYNRAYDEEKRLGFGVVMEMAIVDSFAQIIEEKFRGTLEEICELKEEIEVLKKRENS